MPAFFDDITGFYGTGERDCNGLTLEEFLERHDPKKYELPGCTTDAVVFSYRERVGKNLTGLKLLLIKRKNHPSIGYWALPGGFIEIREDLYDTAKRELEEETGVKDLIMEQVATYGDWKRDPRARVITTAYMALVRENEVKVQAGDDAADAIWCDVSLDVLESQGSDYKKYLLKVDNGSKNLHTEAVVEYKCRGGIIREEKYTAIEKGLIVSDHAAIIVQALLKLQSRL